ncbi:MAG: hypothetical protein V3T60_11710 [Candidatus Binatia bacterium]
MALRQRILDRLKEIDDQDHGQSTNSEALISDLGAERNAVCINIVALHREDLVEMQEMGGGIPTYIVRLTPKGRATVEEPRSNMVSDTIFPTPANLSITSAQHGPTIDTERGAGTRALRRQDAPLAPPLTSPETRVSRSAWAQTRSR